MEMTSTVKTMHGFGLDTENCRLALNLCDTACMVLRFWSWVTIVLSLSLLVSVCSLYIDLILVYSTSRSSFKLEAYWLNCLYVTCLLLCINLIRPNEFLFRSAIVHLGLIARSRVSGLVLQILSVSSMGVGSV